MSLQSDTGCLITVICRLTANASPVETVCGWHERWLERGAANSQWTKSSSQSEHERGGGIHDDTKVEQCIIHQEKYSSPSSVSASVEPRLYPRQCNLQTYFPRREQNRGCCQQSLLTIGSVFLPYLWVDKLSKWEKVILPAPNVNMSTPLTHLNDSLWLSSSVVLNGLSLLIGSVLVLWFWNHTLVLKLW